jgi:hypothetical protein
VQATESLAGVAAFATDTTVKPIAAAIKIENSVFSDVWLKVFVIFALLVALGSSFPDGANVGLGQNARHPIATKRRLRRVNRRRRGQTEPDPFSGDGPGTPRALW